MAEPRRSRGWIWYFLLLAAMTVLSVTEQGVVVIAKAELFAEKRE